MLRSADDDARSAAVGIALTLSTVNPDFHAFCVLDTSISYPHRDAEVSPAIFIFLSVGLPLAIIALVSLYFPGPKTAGRLPPEQIWHQRLGKMNSSLLGLGVSIATTTIIVTGVKNLTGKPRPNFLERCNPDLDNIAAHTVGGFGQAISNLWVMVDQEICEQPNKKWLNDGFRSFPSGYAASKFASAGYWPADHVSAVSFAGLWYLSLFLCAKFSVFIPNPSSTSKNRGPRNEEEADEPLLQGGDGGVAKPPPCQESAVPPVYLLILPYVPLGLAIFIAGTRYFDFTNHGFDVLAGVAVGTGTAWFGFRLYHPPLWGPVRADWD